jgi:hypothetical protein
MGQQWIATFTEDHCYFVVILGLSMTFLHFLPFQFWKTLTTRPGGMACLQTPYRHEAMRFGFLFWRLFQFGRRVQTWCGGIGRPQMLRQKLNTEKTKGAADRAAS